MKKIALFNLLAAGTMLCAVSINTLAEPRSFCVQHSSYETEHFYNIVPHISKNALQQGGHTYLGYELFPGDTCSKKTLEDSQLQSIAITFNPPCTKDHKCRAFNFSYTNNFVCGAGTGRLARDLQMKAWTGGAGFCTNTNTLEKNDLLIFSPNGS